ncbi:MAG: 50S ribosomal protein L11 methyltransferase [Thermodesulfobacteriota bacterium]|nr:50S ribosomal protein L11 methyltransferase [Thermodesulfobacteriota bacterium]
MSADNIIRKTILEVVSHSPIKLTPLKLEKTAVKKFALGKKQVKSVIKDLIARGELTYTNQYGCTFVEKSFHRPVRISNHVIIKPPEISFAANSGDVVINLSQGASFGAGQHPTTRLAVKGIDYALKKQGYFKKNKNTCLLDVGTGSGILAIAAVRMGIKKGTGIDLDPCAISEARENIKINGLEHRIDICDLAVEKIGRVFSMVTANLRYPTLKRLLPHLYDIIHKKGILVLSGIKTDELANLLDIYREKAFLCRWKEVEQAWAGVVFEKLFD